MTPTSPTTPTAPTAPSTPEPDVTERAVVLLPEDESLSSVVGDMDGAGQGTQFIAAAEARVLCVECRSLISADRLSADAVRRLEGASDPADSLLVVPITCPVCGAVGTLVTHLGADASEEEADVLSAMPRQTTGSPTFDASGSPK